MTLLTTVIGRLEGYHNATFIVDSIRHFGKLSCEAIYNFLSSSGGDAHLLAFVPESLVATLDDYPTQLEKLLSCPEEVTQQFQKELKMIMPTIGNDNLKTVLTPSLGEYKSKDNKVKVVFNNTIKNISSLMFTQLLSYLEETNDKTLVVDISIGLNLYVTSLLEAIRGILVYYKLNNLFQDDERLNVEIAYIPPIYFDNQEVRIELHPYDVKAFFELPIKERNINLNNLIKLSCMDKQKYSEEARKIHSKVKDLKTHLETGRLVYNIIKYNTPLALFHDQISDRLKKFEEIKNFPQRLREVIDSHEKDKREIYKNSETIRISRNYIIDKDFYINLHFHLALLNSAYKFWKQKIDGKEPELKHIQHTFTEVYRKLRLGANSRFLERDCDEISSSVNNYLGDLTQAKLLEEIRWPDKNQTAKPSESILSDRKRNFFAHSGFLRDITKVKKRDNDILLEYDSGPFKREVMPWIENPDR